MFSRSCLKISLKLIEMTAPWLLIFSWIYLSTTLTGLPLLAVFHSWARLGLVHKKAQKLYLPSPPCMPSSTYPWRSPQRPRHIIRAARMPPPTRMSAISPSEYSSRDFIGLEGEMKKYHFRPFHSISSPVSPFCHGINFQIFFSPSSFPYVTFEWHAPPSNTMQFFCSLSLNSLHPSVLHSCELLFMKKVFIFTSCPPHQRE